MNSLAKKYYSVGEESGMQEVLFLNSEPDLEWDKISEKVPDLPKGWFELSRISSEQRKEFVTTLWLDRLPFHPKAHAALSRFFAKIEDIAVVIVKRNGDFFPEMVYSLQDNSSFFRGNPFATEEDIRVFKSEMGVHFPADYLSFLRLHNGFGKLSDLGILSMEAIAEARARVRELLTDPHKAILWKGQVVNPGSLIPFYEDFGLNSFQCFFTDWYPGSEMGNVYLSGVHYTVSDMEDGSFSEGAPAVQSFSKWLICYLKGISSL